MRERKKKLGSVFWHCSICIKKIEAVVELANYFSNCSGPSEATKGLDKAVLSSADWPTYQYVANSVLIKSPFLRKCLIMLITKAYAIRCFLPYASL